MGYGPNQVKQLKARRAITSARIKKIKTSYVGTTGYGENKKNVKSVNVTESLLFGIRKRVKQENKGIFYRKLAITLMLSILVIIVILFGLSVLLH